MDTWNNIFIFSSYAFLIVLILPIMFFFCSGMSTQHDLMRYFIRNVADIATEEGISTGAWEDGLLEEVPYPRSDFKNKLVVQSYFREFNLNSRSQ